MADLKIRIAKVREVENIHSRYIDDNKHKNDRPFDGLRIRAEFEGEDFNTSNEDIPWAFPLLPKTFQSIPKVGEAVIILYYHGNEGQRFYIGPIISQPQFNTFSLKQNGTSLLKPNGSAPLERISDNPNTKGAFPNQNDVAIIGRGAEDIILRMNNGSREFHSANEISSSEIQLRSGVRCEPTNDDNPNMIGNIIFNGVDPAYIQLKYKKGLATKEGHEANSIINLVANRINIMSNKDDNIAHNLGDQNDMISDEKVDEIMDNLHQVPMGDKLVELLKIIKGCIMHHVHPWAGMEQCGDWGGYINKLDGYDIDSILSKYVRIS